MPSLLKISHAVFYSIINEEENIIIILVLMLQIKVKLKQKYMVMPLCGTYHAMKMSVTRIMHVHATIVSVTFTANAS